MIQQLLNSNAMLSELLEYSRYFGIPVGNLPKDPTMFVSDLTFARYFLPTDARCGPCKAVSFKCSGISTDTTISCGARHRTNRIWAGKKRLRIDLVSRLIACFFRVLYRLNISLLPTGWIRKSRRTPGVELVNKWHVHWIKSNRS